MPEPTINLQKALELWVDFGTQYWDDQRNQIQDHSGYGRHATASGGPTIGVDGPDDFEATSFDGSDDNFDVGDPVAVSGPQTVATLVRYRSRGNQYWLGNDDGSSGWRIWVNAFDGRASVSFWDGNGDSVVLPTTGVRTPTDRFVWHILHWDGETLSFIWGDDARGGTFVENSTSVSTHTVGADAMQIGDSAGSHLDGDCAIVGRWSRALSWSEMQYLNRLTAPRRANL